MTHETCPKCSGASDFASNRCHFCGGSGKVPAVSEFVDAARAAVGEPTLSALQALEWLRSQARPV